MEIPVNTISRKVEVPVGTITRLEVIDDTYGRVYSNIPCSIELSVQDSGRTLKVFVKHKRDQNAKLDIKLGASSASSVPIVSEIVSEGVIRVGGALYIRKEIADALANRKAACFHCGKPPYQPQGGEAG